MEPQNMVTLGSICNFQNGRCFKKTEWNTKGIPIIRIQNLNNPNAGFNYFEGEYDKKIEINKGDLLFSWSGTIGSSFGAYIWEREKAVLNQHIFKVSLNENIDKRYAFHALEKITTDIEKQVNGAVGLVHITKAKLKEFEIPIPILTEQKRIVSILDKVFASIDKAISNTERNIANARELFQSKLDATFHINTNNWAQYKLADVLDTQPRNGWSPPARNHSDAGTPVLTLSSVTGFNFDLKKIKYTSAITKNDSHYWIENGNLLITRSNTHDLVGHVAIVSDVVKPMIESPLIC